MTTSDFFQSFLVDYRFKNLYDTLNLFFLKYLEMAHDRYCMRYILQIFTAALG